MEVDDFDWCKIIEDIIKDFFMRKHSTDLQEAYCQHIINTQNFYWEKYAIMKTVTDNFTINVGNSGNNIVDIDYTLITNLMHWLLFIHKNTTLLYMFRASSAHLQEDIVVYKQRMVPSLSYKSSWWPVNTQLAAYRQATRNSYREWRYHMLHVYNYVLLKMSTW